jgi:hypothetical protein
MLLSGHLSVRTGWTCLASCAPAPRTSHGHTGPASRRLRLPSCVVHPCISRLARSHRTRLAPCAPRTPCLTPPLVPRAAFPAPHQLASIGQQQVDERMFQPYVSCVSDVYMFHPDVAEVDLVLLQWLYTYVAF